MFCEPPKKARIQASDNHGDSDNEAIHGFVHIDHTKIIAFLIDLGTHRPRRTWVTRQKATFPHTLESDLNPIEGVTL